VNLPSVLHSRHLFFHPFLESPVHHPSLFTLPFLPSLHLLHLFFSLSAHPFLD
jgi:hypothetical protein